MRDPAAPALKAAEAAGAMSETTKLTKHTKGCATWFGDLGVLGVEFPFFDDCSFEPGTAGSRIYALFERSVRDDERGVLVVATTV